MFVVRWFVCFGVVWLLVVVVFIAGLDLICWFEVLLVFVGGAWCVWVLYLLLLGNRYYEVVDLGLFGWLLFWFVGFVDCCWFCLVMFCLLVLICFGEFGYLPGLLVVWVWCLVGFSLGLLWCLGVWCLVGWLVYMFWC